MATFTPAADQAADLVQKLSLDTQTKTHNVQEVTKKSNGSVERSNLANGNAPSSERSTTPILQDFVDPSMYYLSSGYASQPYYFGTYNNKWDDYSRYVNPDEVPGVYGDFYPGYGYAPYGAYAPPGSPVPTAGPDGQLYGPQQYQYPGLYYMPSTPSSSTLTSTSQPPTSRAEVSGSAASEEPTVSVDATKMTTKGTSNGSANGDVGSVPLKHNHQKPLAWHPFWLPPDPRYAYDGMRSPVPWLDGPAFLDGQHRQAATSTLSSMGLNTQRSASGMGPGSHGLMSRMYPNSRIEDDVHKSIKYGVWASTVNGNKKLHSAYQESKERWAAAPSSCFSHGQFVGVAEMVGPVDFNKTVDYWQQDRWNGCFPVMWHIVKDVPNSMLKHIILENNDNKPVTNSRDTQEVKLEQGLQMLKLFKEHVSKTSILDDFLFYEVRQKTMQEKRAKQQQFLKQVSARNSGDGPVVEEKGKEGTAEKAIISQNPVESAAFLSKETIDAALGESKLGEETCMAAALVNPTLVNDAQKVAILAAERNGVANGIANSC
ncbi:unnamed protein product [Spirodela intermedia]|uniref:YTH domain-containing family protein n=1 Tax=Spirodela intermedia TaxID=51605 RepID=A0A7I8IL88_SPIIN|nr:unnamed protein product [Spirodela intermedia]CAA6658572.1 unnamed protein product [Spirodela intermedia]